MLSRVLTITLFLCTLIVNSQENKYKVFNTSINSAYAELGAQFLDEGTIVYASSKKIEEDQTFKKVRRRRQRQLFIALYKGIITENGDITDQGRFLNITQQNINLSDFAIAPDGKTIYFTWNNYHPYMIDTIENYWNNLRIMKGTINAQNEIDIPNAHPLPFVNEKNNYNQVALSADGKTLYFSADLPKGAGGKDLYKVNINADGSYSEPKNLGNAVNSSQDELFPFIDASNTLYFSSYGHRGMGGLDIFKSKSENGEFKTIDKMDAPINSKADDFGLIINPTTQKGYFTSNRADGVGNVDIYAFEPDIPECFQNLMATFVHSETEKQLNNVQVSVIDEKGETLNSMFVTEFQVATLPLKCEKELLIRIEKEGYETLDASIQTSETYDKEIPRTFELVEIPCTQVIAGEILHKLELHPELDTKITLFANEQLVSEEVLTGKNNFSIELPCNTEYTLAVTKDGFETVSAKVQTGNTLGDTISKRLLIAPRICSQTIEIAAVNADNSKPVSRFKARLLEGAKLIHEKNIVNGNQLSFSLNCNSSYSIEIEKVGFEPFVLAQNTDDNYDSSYQNTVQLTPIPCTQFVVLEGATEKDKNALANATVAILKDGVAISSGTAMNQIEIPCNADITLQINSEGFDTKNIKVRSNNEFEKVHEMRVTFVETVCEQEFVLTVADANSKAGLSNFEVTVRNGENDQKQIKNGSNASLMLHCESNYILTISKENYESVELAITTKKTHGERLTETVYLTPKECTQLITGRIIDNNSDEALSRALLTISSGNAFTKTLALDANGNYSFKAECGETYILKASLLDYGNKEVKITTSSKYNETVEQSIRLQKDLEFSTIAGQRMINTNNITFDLNKTDVTMETAIELNKVVALLKKYPNMSLMVKSHTDSRAPDQLNLNLTEGRAAAIKEYLIAQGIDALRVIAKGLGETELLNKCANGVKCSDEEHRKNRRTEFIVTSN